MKLINIALLAASVALLASCNKKIPDESIYTELDSAAIQKASKVDTSFALFYEGVREMVQYYGPNEQFETITYRRLYDYIKSFSDTSKIQPLNDAWEQEWRELSAVNLQRADSLIEVWQQFVDSHPEISLEEEINKSDPRVPLTVAGCLANKDNPQLYEWVRDLMIAAEIDSNHIAKNSYLDKKFVEYSKAKDSLCYLFIFSGMLGM